MLKWNQIEESEIQSCNLLLRDASRVISVTIQKFLPSLKALITFTPSFQSLSEKLQELSRKKKDPASVKRDLMDEALKIRAIMDSWKICLPFFEKQDATLYRELSKEVAQVLASFGL